MLRSVLVIMLLAIGTAHAQPQTSPTPAAFVPYTIDQETHLKIMNYLGEQPARVAIPLIQLLSELAQRAVAEKNKPAQVTKK